MVRDRERHRRRLWAVAALLVGPALVVAARPAPSLSALLVTKAPAGYARTADGFAGTGSVTLAKAAKADGRADARQVLTSDHFQAGWDRRWSSPSGSIIFVYLYRFATAQGASAYMNRIVAQEHGDKGVVDTFATLSSVPGSVTLQSHPATKHPRFRVAAAIFTHGGYLAEIGEVTEKDSSAQLFPLAIRQYHRLPVNV